MINEDSCFSNAKGNIGLKERDVSYAQSWKGCIVLFSSELSLGPYK